MQQTHIRSAQRSARTIACILITATLIGCAAPQRNPVPRELVGKATILGMPLIRDFGDQHSPVLQRSIVQSIEQSRTSTLGAGFVDREGYVSVLSLSGGGANGAFGAGLLCGWTKSGKRPTFKLVTGISTGALLATFAFLGADYDGVLRECYTTLRTQDIYTEKNLLGIMLDAQSVTDTTPLRRLIAKQISPDVFAAVAAEHQKGRRLFVGTTNLDAGKLVIWDMGAIASCGHPRAIELYREVLRASAAIPVAFPPVFFDVEADGSHHQEMHVDGGVATQVFFYGFSIDLAAAFREAGVSTPRPIRLYVVRNGQLTNNWKPIVPRLLPIADRTVNSMIGAQVVGDLYRIYAIAQHEHIEFNLAHIPDDYVSNAAESFDPVEMTKLFNMAYDAAVGGYQWKNLPPGFDRLGERPGVSAGRRENR